MAEYTNNCPVCGEPSVSSCRCPCGEKRCKNGHTWHRCTIHDVCVIGAADHSKDTYRCTCGAGNANGVRGVNSGN